MIRRTPIKYYGGKTKMLPHILPLIPEHRIYVEAFAGGAALYFSKAASKVEILNDINRNVTNFYKVMKTHFDSLLEEIEGTLHCEASHRYAKDIYHNPKGYSEIKRAWAFWVATNMSFGGEAAGSFQWVRNKTDNWHPAIAISNRRQQFKYYKGRLSTTSIRNHKAEILIPKLDGEDVFFYCDPPYVGARQGHYKGYTSIDFKALLDSLSNIQGKFILSSYKNSLLDQYTKGNDWNRLEIKQRLGVASGQQEKVEVLTWNFDMENQSPQLKIF